MTSIYKGLAAASVLVMGLGVTPAVASCHGDWDANSDTSIDQTEFGTAYDRVGWFGNADADDSGSLSSDEFSAGLYGAYDRDDSGTFSEDERDVGFSVADDYTPWDADQSGDLTEEEFTGGMTENDLFNEWDADDNDELSQDEFDAGVYGRYDADDSGNLEETEVSASCDDFGEEGFWDF